MTFAGFTRLLPDGFAVTLADVGSAGGLQGRWRPARRWIKGLLFEPREGGEIRREGADTIFPVALGTAPGTATLNITRLANMSSTLLPNAELLSAYRKKGEDVAIVDKLELAVDTLDRICAQHALAVDAIKVDTQGSELTILAGAEEGMADTVLLAEVELSFLERYHGQALAADVLPYMAERGFDLIELYRPKRYRAKNQANVVSPASGGAVRSGRVAYADGIFFVGEKRLQERLAKLPREEAETIALRAMLALLIYGKPDIAARTLDLSATYLDPARREALAAWFRSLAKGNPVKRLARKAGNIFGRRG